MYHLNYGNKNCNKHAISINMYVCIYIYIYIQIHGCSVSRCNRQAEITLVHFMIFH